jgi:GntR family transcriptional regulator
MLRREVAAPDPSEMLKLGLTGSEQVLRLSRVRLSDGEPLAIEHAVVPARRWTRARCAIRFMMRCGRQGNMPVRALQRLHAAVATATEARLLEVAQGSPVLRIERRSFLPNGRPIEVTTRPIAATAMISLPN